MTALAGGVPQVVVPLFSMDQFLNAARVMAEEMAGLPDVSEAVPVLERLAAA